jgi:hypothetical protein
MDTAHGSSIPAAPDGWRNWRAQELPWVQRVEHGLYSDSTFVGELRGLGPYGILNGGGRGHEVTPGVAQQALVLRHDWHLRLSATLTATTSTEGYHHGSVDEEVAALLSLALDVRCRSGGPLRFWWDADDKYGRPDITFHRPPLLTRPRSAAMLPRQTRDGVELEPAREFLNLYSTVAPREALLILRAARQWQQAIWNADSDPGLAWLQLVGALEVAAQAASQDATPLETVRDVKPEWADLLRDYDHPRAEDMIREAAQLLGARRKVRLLLERYPPAPPPIRPEYGRVDWSNLEKAVMAIYTYRSKALHEGHPMPAPLLEAPIAPGSPWAERPTGTTGVGESSWAEKDLPMYMHTFAYVVGETLRAWWRSFAAASPAAEQ